MKTAMQELLEWHRKSMRSYSETNKMVEAFIEKEKEQIQKAFSDGQETPLNHPASPHYSREEYYNDNYNQ